MGTPLFQRSSKNVHSKHRRLKYLYICSFAPLQELFLEVLSSGFWSVFLTCDKDLICFQGSKRDLEAGCRKVCVWHGALQVQAMARFPRNCLSQLQLKSVVSWAGMLKVLEASALKDQPKASFPLSFTVDFFVKEWSASHLYSSFFSTHYDQTWNSEKLNLCLIIALVL